jgi:tetratricopeptide (TPR) repeat protein
VWARTIGSGFQADGDLARKMLTNWQVEPDLAGLREPNALDELSLDKRKDCLTLWHELRIVLKRTAQQRPKTALDPKHMMLIQQRRLEKARVAWQTALEGNPLDHTAWSGYAELCLFLGLEDEYRRARRELLARFFVTSNPYFAERTGRACLLLPATGDELLQAVTLTRRAAASDPSIHAAAYPWFLFARALGEYRQGRFDQAIATMRSDASRVDTPNAHLVPALILRQDGQLAEARKALAEAILTYDWRPTQARDPVAWIRHVLRREAEGLILPNLPAFLDGKYQLQDNHERLALLAAQFGTWEFRGLHGAAGVIKANERQHVAAWERAIAEYRKLVSEQPADGALLTKGAALYHLAGRTREAVGVLAEASAANAKETLL